MQDCMSCLTSSTAVAAAANPPATKPAPALPRSPSGIRNLRRRERAGRAYPPTAVVRRALCKPRGPVRSHHSRDHTLSERAANRRRGPWFQANHPAPGMKTSAQPCDAIPPITSPMPLEYSPVSLRRALTGSRSRPDHPTAPWWRRSCRRQSSTRRRCGW